MVRSLLCSLALLLLSCSGEPSPAARSAHGNAPPPRPAAPAVAQPWRTPPPAPRCLPGRRRATPERLADEAARAFDDRAYGRALSCAEEALRAAPRLVAALQLRAASLAELDRMDEARAAYERALAVDPDDPEMLWGAANFLVIRLGDRESLRLGVEHAARGARLAQRRRDRHLAGRMFLLAGMAENDLGRSAEALARIDQALAEEPRDPDAIYERGVALYELCRFREARRAFESVLQRMRGDAWAVHYLGLIAERDGDERRARALLARAAALAPGDIPRGIDVGRVAFETEVRRAVAALPPSERQALAGVPVQVEELPALEDLTAVDPPLSPSILGLYRGPPEREPCAPGEGPRCRAIVFYHKNLVRFARDRRELSEQVRVTLLHELGHLHGESDDDLRDRGLE